MIDCDCTPIYTALLREFEDSATVSEFRKLAALRVKVSSNRNGSKSPDWNKMWNDLCEEFWRNYNGQI